jgi:serine/threonine protein kinase
MVVGAKLYELKAEGLEARFFGGVTLEGNAASSSNSPSSGSDRPPRDVSGASGSVSGSYEDRAELQTAVGEGMMFKEDTFLTSANLCRWIIDFGEIQVGKQVGLGSYGVVYRGKWKGVDVAVKRFIKQKLDERRMLEFRAEMAFLSELHHPNIVLFIGTFNTRHTTHDTRHTTHDTRHTTHDTRYTTHDTRHTAHGTRHTTHDTRHTTHA